MFRLYAIFVLAFAMGCSAPRPATKRTKLLSAEETSRKAGESARQAEKDNNTGVLIGSSSDRSAPEVSEPKPAAEAPQVRVLVDAGTVTSDEVAVEPGVFFKAVAAKDMNTIIVLQATDGTPYAEVVAVIDAAKAAGLQDIVLEAAAEPAVDFEEPSIQ